MKLTIAVEHRERKRGGGIYNHFKTKLEEKMYAFVPAFKHIIGLR